MDRASDINKFVANDASKFVHLERTLQKGMSLIAKEKISKGETIVIERPLGFVRSSREDLRYHEASLLDSASRSLGRSVDYKSLILAGRIYESIEKHKISQFEQLCINDRIEINAASVTIVGNLLRGVGITADPRKVTQILQRLPSNSFTAYDTSLNVIGISFYFLSSYFNHSCDPNCYQSFTSDGSITIRSVCDIAIGDELCISYINTGMPTWCRRSELLSAYGFVCQCHRCVSVDLHDSVHCLRCHKRCLDSSAWEGLMYMDVMHHGTSQATVSNRPGIKEFLQEFSQFTSEWCIFHGDIVLKIITYFIANANIANNNNAMNTTSMDILNRSITWYTNDGPKASITCEHCGSLTSIECYLKGIAKLFHSWKISSNIEINDKQKLQTLLDANKTAVDLFGCHHYSIVSINTCLCSIVFHAMETFTDSIENLLQQTELQSSNKSNELQTRIRESLQSMTKYLELFFRYSLEMIASSDCCYPLIHPQKIVDRMSLSNVYINFVLSNRMLSHRNGLNFSVDCHWIVSSMQQSLRISEMIYGRNHQTTRDIYDMIQQVQRHR